jgi:hypothetical protein
MSFDFPERPGLGLNRIVSSAKSSVKRGNLLRDQDNVQSKRGDFDHVESESLPELPENQTESDEGSFRDY